VIRNVNGLLIDRRMYNKFMEGDGKANETFARTFNSAA
jgi:hypothetical protein